MKFKDFQDFKDRIEVLKNQDIPKNLIINGWEFKKLSGKIVQYKLGNIQEWQVVYNNSQINQSVVLELTVRYIKTKDILKIKTINYIELY